MGLPCAEMWYFDLLAMGFKLEDCTKPWLIKDYQEKCILRSNLNICVEAMDVKGARPAPK